MVDKQLFKNLVAKHIQREGIDTIMDGLEKSDFYDAPASTRFHDSEKGGLVHHSLRVFDELCKMPEIIASDYSMETLAIVSLFHDICKIGFYTIEMRNSKVNGKWIKVPYYGVDDKFPMGHGDKSVIMLMESMKLSYSEMLAIRWHMGLSVPKEEYGTMSTAFNQVPLALYLHIADMKATYKK